MDEDLIRLYAIMLNDANNTKITYEDDSITVIYFDSFVVLGDDGIWTFYEHGD